MVGSWWSVVGVLGLGTVFVNPKKFALVCMLSCFGCCVVFFSSTNPSLLVGTFILDFGILTTPLFWSSRMSIISGFLFLLKSMILLSCFGFKILWLVVYVCFGLVEGIYVNSAWWFVVYFR